MQLTAEQEQLLEQASSLAVKLDADDTISKGKGMASRKGLYSGKFDEALKKAEAELKKSAAKQAVCAAVVAGCEDLRDLTKMMGAALLPLMLTGVVSLPLTPLALAAAGIVLFRMSVASYCADAGSGGKSQA